MRLENSNTEQQMNNEILSQGILEGSKNEF